MAPDEVDKAVGVAVRDRRLDIGMTQSQLAAEVGVSYQQIQKYEGGANRVSSGMLFKMAYALQIAPSAIIRAVEESTKSRDRSLRPDEAHDR